MWFNRLVGEVLSAYSAQFIAPALDRAQTFIPDDSDIQYRDLVDLLILANIPALAAIKLTKQHFDLGYVRFPKNQYLDEYRERLDKIGGLIPRGKKMGFLLDILTIRRSVLTLRNAIELNATLGLWAQIDVQTASENPAASSETAEQGCSPGGGL